MSGNGERALDEMAVEFEKTASLLRGAVATETLRSRIAALRAPVPESANRRLRESAR